jgi:hypothetical protein
MNNRKTKGHAHVWIMDKGRDEFETYTNICLRKCISKLRVINLLNLQKKTNQRIQIDGKHPTYWEVPGSFILSMDNRR